MTTSPLDTAQRTVTIPAGAVRLSGTLRLPSAHAGIVLFAHGSGSSRLSPRNRFVAQVLEQEGMGTLLFDLLTDAEARSRSNVFDVQLLASRLRATTDWVVGTLAPECPPIGYFGASTGAAAALVAARGDGRIRAVVSRGGRPDLAGELLREVRVPTLLIVGGDDVPVVSLNEAALAALGGEKRLAIVPGATHLFEEPGALEEVARLASEWFRRHLARSDVRHMLPGR